MKLVYCLLASVVVDYKHSQVGDVWGETCYLIMLVQNILELKEVVDEMFRRYMQIDALRGMNQASFVLFGLLVFPGPLAEIGHLDVEFMFLEEKRG